MRVLRYSKGDNFLNCFVLMSIVICKIIFCKKIILVMDRTNWKIGKKNINVLFIGMLLKNKTYIPLIYKPLGDKRGNSSQEERIKMLEKFTDIFSHLPI